MDAPCRAIVNWPHAPPHWFIKAGVVHDHGRDLQKATASQFSGVSGFFLAMLFARAVEFGSEFRARAALANHYHFIAASPPAPQTLRKFLGELHMPASKQLNVWDNAPGWKVWFQFWHSRIEFERSYLARLNYVHQNPVHHGVVAAAANYNWCSALRFARSASGALVTMVRSFEIDRLKVPDDF